MSEADALDHRKLYRLPWSLTDNVVSWLEPTKQCNMHCEGCYSANVKGSHKSLEAIRADLDVFQRYRQTDAVSVAGGDPLTHPQIVEVVAEIARRGLKPVVNTNGLAMTPELLRELAAAGLKGVTFHIDTSQQRPGWTGKSELELNALRLSYAEMVASVGGISCAFNATVFEHTLPLVPEIVAWGHQHADKVNVLVFIAFRSTLEGAYDYYVGGDKVDTNPLVYREKEAKAQRTSISAREVVAAIRSRFPEFAPAAYLNGTERPDDFKWLMTLTVTDREELLGSVGPRVTELSQVLNHLVHGRYLGYVGPEVHHGAKKLLALGAIDPGMRGVAKRWAAKVARRPLAALEPLHLQSVMVIQPVDVLPDGRASMCDGCPDMTVHQGELVWSCRLEERLEYGQFMRAVPAKREKAEA